VVILRVTIIGIDGLDYNIVEEMDLKNLKQEVYGKLTIPRECYREIKPGVYSPWTPLCWMSIITGNIPPEKYHQEKKMVYSNELLEFFRNRFGKYLNFWKGKRKLLMKTGFKLTKYEAVETPHIRDMNTIFDLAENVIEVNIPSYSEDYTLRPFGKEREGVEHLKLFDREDSYVKKFIKSVIKSNKEYDLFMAYMRAIDHYGHQKYGTKDLFNRYKLMDFFINEIKNDVDGLLLICSDHGFQRLDGTSTGGRHSDYAYYSLNLDLRCKMESLLDIYSCVEFALKIKKGVFGF
jgi:hypothetical protein